MCAANGWALAIALLGPFAKLLAIGAGLQLILRGVARGGSGNKGGA